MNVLMLAFLTYLPKAVSANKPYATFCQASPTQLILQSHSVLNSCAVVDKWNINVSLDLSTTSNWLCLENGITQGGIIQSVITLCYVYTHLKKLKGLLESLFC